MQPTLAVALADVEIQKAKDANAKANNCTGCEWRFTRASQQERGWCYMFSFPPSGCRQFKPKPTHTTKDDK